MKRWQLWFLRFNTAHIISINKDTGIGIIHLTEVAALVVTEMVGICTVMEDNEDTIAVADMLKD
jgi:hypothetical protein